MALTNKPDLVSRGMSFLPSYWDDKPKAKGLLQSLLTAFQNPLDLLFEILNGTSLDDAEGVQIDIIGSLWNVPRLSKTDEEYKEAIRQTMAIDEANSTIPNIIALLKTATSAANVQIFEHLPGNIHAYMNTSLVDDLKEFGESITAAGVSFNPMFLPLDDNKNGVVEGLYDTTDMTTSTGGSVVVTPSLDVDPEGTFEMLDMTDNSNTSVAVHQRIMTSVDVEVGDIYYAHVFVRKDVASPNSLRFEFKTSGPDIINNGINLDIDTGDISGANVEVTDVGDFYLLTSSVEPSIAGSYTIFMQIIPAFNSTIAAAPADVTATGTITVWKPAVYTKKGKYSTDVPSGIPLICSTTSVEFSNIIDGSSNNIVDDLGNQIVAVSEVIALGTIATPLPDIYGFSIGHPLVIVEN